MKISISRDINGNKTLKIQPANARGFSIQTLGNLPLTHRMTRDTIDQAAALREAEAYVARHGTPRQKRAMGLTSESA